MRGSTAFRTAIGVVDNSERQEGIGARRGDYGGPRARD